MKKSASHSPLATLAHAHRKIASDILSINRQKIALTRVTWQLGFKAKTNQAVVATRTEALCYLKKMLGATRKTIVETIKCGPEIHCDIWLKGSGNTEQKLRSIVKDLGEICLNGDTKFYFVGFSEDLYSSPLWKQIRDVLNLSEQLIPMTDCRILRFDGLYQSACPGGCDYLRFYEDGTCIAAVVSGDDSLQSVRKWFGKQKKHLT